MKKVLNLTTRISLFLLLFFTQSCIKQQGVKQLSSSNNKNSQLSGRKVVLENNGIEQIDLDGKCYLFRSKNKTNKNLIISSHGGIELEHKVDNTFTVAKGTTFHYYANDNEILPDIKLRHIMYRAVPICENITEGNRSPDYLLCKYQSELIKETYSSIIDDLVRYNKRELNLPGLEINKNYFLVRNINTELEARVKQKNLEIARQAEQNVNFDEGFDVLTIRNRMFSTKKITANGKVYSSLRLSNVIKLLENNGYQYANIHCSFCRSNF